MNESAHGRLLSSVVARPRVWLAGIALLTLPFALALPKLKLWTEGSALHPVGSTVIAATLEVETLFRDPPAIYAMIVARRGGGIFTSEGLAFVRVLTDTLRACPGVRSDEVVSLATALDVTSSAERIRLTRFLDPLPRSAAEIDSLGTRLGRDELYEGFLYGRDQRSALIVVPLVEAHAPKQAIARIRSAIARAPHASYDVHVTGPLVAETLLGDQILKDLYRLVPIVVGAVAVTLFLCLRFLAGALVPMLGMLVVLVWTFGAMAMLGVPLTIVTIVLPVLLMAMAITDQIHLLERFHAHLAGGDERAGALRRAIAEVGPPIVHTSITTALGFLSFLATSVIAMRHFGAFAAFGLAIAMIVSFTLVPAALMLVPRSWLARFRSAGHERAPRGIEAWAASRPRAAIAMAALVLGVALIGLPRIQVQDSWVQNFDPRSELAVAERVFDQQYRGSYRLDVTLESDEDGYFQRAAGLAIVDSIERAIARSPEVAGTQSLATLVRSGMRAVDPMRSPLALDDTGLAQLLLLLQMSGSQEPLDRLITPSGRATRIRCFVRGADYAKAARLIEHVKALGTPLASRGVSLRATGDLAVAAEVVRATVTNQVRSVAWTLLALAVYLAIAFQSIALAGVLLIPVVATTLVVFGGMGWFMIPLGVATSMFAALAEGEGIDFSIHLASRYRDLRAERASEAALRETLGSVGAAVRWTGVALIAGCLVLCLSELRPVRALGVLLAAGLAVNYLMAFLILPWLLPKFGVRAKR